MPYSVWETGREGTPQSHPDEHFSTPAAEGQGGTPGRPGAGPSGRGEPARLVLARLRGQPQPPGRVPPAHLPCFNVLGAAPEHLPRPGTGPGLKQGREGLCGPSVCLPSGQPPHRHLARPAHLAMPLGALARQAGLLAILAAPPRPPSDPGRLPGAPCFPPRPLGAWLWPKLDGHLLICWWGWVGTPGTPPLPPVRSLARTRAAL